MQPRIFKLSGRKAMIMVLKKRILYVFICSWLSLHLALGLSNAIAQQLPDVKLEPVEIVEQRLSPFAIGARTQSFDSILFTLEALPNLADIINNYTSIGVKSYGNGMLSTISFRGTGASHTAVLWHGINIAYPMLGQSDLSILSMALNDQVVLQAGTGGALYGSGALGGTVSLTNSQPALGTSLSISQWFGSFGTIKNSIRASYAHDKFSIKILTLWDRSDNSFEFINSTKVGSPTEVQEGADYRILGTSLESQVVIGERGKLNISAQYLNADRNLQPSMNSNSLADNQTDENLRLRARYQSDGNNLTWNVNYAFLKDGIGFNGSKTYANQHVFRAEMGKTLMTWFNFNVAADYTFSQITSPFYESDVTTDNRANLWAALLANPIERLLLSLNLRQAFSPQYSIPFMPSLGAEYVLVNGSGHNLIAKSLFARGFRIPTLNEQYWQPGGNPDLIPEDSYSFELGVSGKSLKGQLFDYEFTAYRMLVDNWILWTPQGGYWSPENIRHVDVYGIELSGTYVHRLAAAKVSWQGNYAYTRSINRTGIDSYDRSVNKQLTYTPIHRATISSLTDIDSWSVLINAAYTGGQYVTADNEESLPGYLLLNLRLGKEFVKGKFLFNVQGNINNMLNTNYQSIKNKAMPGINFLLGLTISYYKSNQ